MARPYKGIKDFTAKIRDLSKRPQIEYNLFAVLLFDDRPSHKPIVKFINEHFEWLDQLAENSKLLLFLFSEKKLKVRDAIERMTPTAKSIKEATFNPSLNIASTVGITPKELPGIVFMTAFDAFEKFRGNRTETRTSSADSNYSAVFLPIKAELFNKDLQEIELIFSDLFSFIQESRQDCKDADDLIQAIRKKVLSLKRGESVRPAMSYLKASLLTVISLPWTLVEAMGKTFSEEMAKRIVAP